MNYKRKDKIKKQNSISGNGKLKLKGGIHTLTEILETIEEKIPSPERLFGYLWIISWFVAIWIYTLQFFLTGFFCLFLAFVIFERNEEKERHKFPAIFTMNKVAKTLTVQKIYDTDLSCEKTEVCSGDATLPSGIIKEGDTIINCCGNVALRHIPTNILFGAYDFK